MSALSKVFFLISIFRRGPQDLPASAFLLWLTMLLNTLFGLGVMAVYGDYNRALIQQLSGLCIVAGFVWCVLRLSGRQNRFLQTLSAQLGADMVTTVIAVPILYLVFPDSNSPVVLVFLLAYTVWNVAIFGHILRHALSASFGFGLGLSILFTIASFMIRSWLFPN